MSLRLLREKAYELSATRRCCSILASWRRGAMVAFCAGGCPGGILPHRIGSHRRSGSGFGRYLEVNPHARLVWTNEDGGDGGAVTTVTFEEKGGRTLLVMHELHPTKEALDEALAGMESGTPETFEQLDELLVTLGTSGERS